MSIKTKLASLRKIMRSEKIDAFLLPHGEDYNGDYNPAYVQGLQEVFGFTGSMGAGLITLKHAYLFIDGRYTIQAKQETKGTEILCQDYTYENIRQALLKEKTQMLGIDKSLFSENDYRKIESFGFKIKSLSKSPLDKLWDSLPAEPITPAFELPLKYAGKPTTEKRKDICTELKAMGAEASFISAADSIAWLLNIRGNDVENFPVCLSNGILLANGKFLWFVNPKKTQNVKIKNTEMLAPEKLFSTMKKLKLKTIHLDPSSVSAKVFEQCRNAKINIVQAKDLCQLPKACKNESEMRNARLAHKWDGVALCEFLHWFEKNAPKGKLDEMTASDKLWHWRAKNPKCKERSFETISATAANGAQCHYRATPKSNRRIKKGDIYLVDSGGQYFEGTTDVTRTVAVGGTPPAEVKDHFTRVLKGHIAIATARFPHGIAGGHLDPLARSPLWEAGLNFAHGTGHGVGSYLNVHEGPQNISPNATATPLRHGMIVSNEPGYYKEGAYGIRIENLVLVKNTGKQSEQKSPLYEFETLTLAPIDKTLIKKSMLNEEEKKWLNAYHKLVCQKLSPHLQPATRRWLKSATAPL